MTKSEFIVGCIHNEIKQLNESVFVNYSGHQVRVKKTIFKRPALSVLIKSLGAASVLAFISLFETSVTGIKNSISYFSLK